MCLLPKSCCIFFSIVLLFSIGCSEQNHQEFIDVWGESADLLPFSLKAVQVKKFEGPLTWVDLDGDGADECIKYYVRSDNVLALMFFDQEGHVRQQFNIPNGKITTPWFQPLVADLDRDKLNEIVFGYVRGDTSFLCVLDEDLQTEQQRFPVAVAPPGFGTRGEKPFLVQPLPQFILDFDNNDTLDVVLTYRTSFEPQPRGIFVYNLESGRLLASYAMPMSPGQGRVLDGGTLWRVDFNNDGRKDFLPASIYAVDNQVEVADYDDSHSYLFLINDQLDARLVAPFGEVFSQVNACPILTPDGIRILAVFTPHALEPGQSPQARLYNPVTLKIERFNNDFNERLQLEFGEGVIIDDLDLNGMPNILLSSENNKWLQLDWQLVRQRTVRFNDRLKPLLAIDLDGNGHKEVISSSKDSHTLFIHNKRFEVLARLHNVDDFRLVNERTGQPPRLAIQQHNANEYGLYVYRRNSLTYFPFVRRFMFVAGVCFLIGLALFSARTKAMEKQLCNLMCTNDETGFLLVNRKGHLAKHNETMTRIIPELGVGNHLDLSLQSDEPFKRNDLTGLLANIFKSGDEQDIIFENEHADKVRRRWRIKALRCRDFLGRSGGMLFILNDKTADLEHERIIAWSAMSQRLAHDIKSPLSTIGLTVQRLQMQYRQDEVPNQQLYDKYVQSVLEETRHFQEVARRFLQFINLDKPKIAPVNLHRFFSEYRERLAGNLPAGITFSVIVSQEELVIAADEQLLRSALQNLIENSVDAMQDEGSIRIFVERAQGLRNAKNKPDDHPCACIEITDTGAGIPRNKLAEVFKPSYTTKPTGTGLGLAITQKIVRDHSGDIIISSREGKGTSVYIYWPEPGASGNA